jgi:hypothetical protein
VLFLLAMRSRHNKRNTPCWVIRRCPTEIKRNCPAWEFQNGHLCWFINGTICEGCAENARYSDLFFPSLKREALSLSCFWSPC